MSLYKRILIIIFILSFFIGNNSFSQENISKISYKGTASVNLSKNDIKNNIKSWFQSYYKNASNIIAKNTETELIANPHFRILNTKSDKGIQTTAGIVQYTIKLYFSEGKYKYELTDFYLKKNTNIPIESWKDKSSPDYNEKYAYYLEQVDKYAKKTIASLEKAMK